MFCCLTHVTRRQDPHLGKCLDIQLCNISLMAIVESDSCHRNRLWAFDQFLMWLLKFILALHPFFPSPKSCHLKEDVHKVRTVQKWWLIRVQYVLHGGTSAHYLLNMCNLSWWVHHIDQPQSKPMVLKWYCLYFYLFLFFFFWCCEKYARVLFSDRFTKRVYIFKWLISECLQ